EAPLFSPRTTSTSGSRWIATSQVECGSPARIHCLPSSSTTQMRVSWSGCVACSLLVFSTTTSPLSDATNERPITITASATSAPTIRSTERMHASQARAQYARRIGPRESSTGLPQICNVFQFRSEGAVGLVEGKSTLVTGAASGIGRATALALAAEGARVLVADRERSGAEVVAKAIAEQGGVAVACPTDVADAAAVEAMVRAALDAFGRLDGAVNAAGVIASAAL